MESSAYSVWSLISIIGGIVAIVPFVRIIGDIYFKGCKYIREARRELNKFKVWLVTVVACGFATLLSPFDDIRTPFAAAAALMSIFCFVFGILSHVARVTTNKFEYYYRDTARKMFTFAIIYAVVAILLSIPIPTDMQ